MSLTSTLISRVNALTALVKSIATKSKLPSELPNASTPLASADVITIQQGALLKQVPVSELIGTPAAPGKIQFGSFQIFGQENNALTTLQSGDFIQGLWSTTEFWYLARYNGGDIALRNSYTIMNSGEF